MRLKIWEEIQLIILINRIIIVLLLIPNKQIKRDHQIKFSNLKEAHPQQMLKLKEESLPIPAPNKDFLLEFM